MYTAYATPLGKLRAYYSQLGDLYRVAIVRRQFARAREIKARRWRVKRAILLREEWAPAGVPTRS
jgi:hypothetical protein